MSRWATSSAALQRFRLMLLSRVMKTCLQDTMLTDWLNHGVFALPKVGRRQRKKK
jgi:hypothetical protein